MVQPRRCNRGAQPGPNGRGRGILMRKIIIPPRFSTMDVSFRDIMGREISLPSSVCF